MVRHFASAIAYLGCHSGELLELPPRPADSSTLGALLTGAVRGLALGAAHTCALLAEGSVKCWGLDQYGALGLDTLGEDIPDPSLTGPVNFGTERRVVQLSAGWHHNCVLFEDARARCWGRNDRGQLGQGNTDDYGDDPGEAPSVLPDVPLERVIAISAGVSNTCAIVSADGASGTVHCWGSDSAGGLGDDRSGDFGDDEPVDASRSVPLPDWASAVAAGDGVSCALLVDGSVHCWGSNTFGTLGIGAGACNVGDERFCEGAGEPRPVQQLGEPFVHSIHLNQAHACALDNSGDLRCWGRNDQSRAGYPESRAGAVLSVTPGPIDLGPGVKVLSVGLGMRHGCSLDSLGDVRCWGEAGPQLGYGMAQRDGVAGVGGTLTPAEQYAGMPASGVVQLGDFDDAPGNDQAVQIYSGGSHNCAIMVSGAVRCFGNNEHGQLGYGPFAQISHIGELRTPALDYERLQRHDVCLKELPGACDAP